MDSNGNTPIHLAASINSLSTLRVLSKYKPDLNIKNVDLDRMVLREFNSVIYSPYTLNRINRLLLIYTKYRPEDVTKDTNCQLYLKLMASIFELDNKRPTLPKRRKLLHDFRWSFDKKSFRFFFELRPMRLNSPNTQELIAPNSFSKFDREHAFSSLFRFWSI